MSAAKSKALELFRSQRLPEARAALEAVCAHEPADAEAWLALGVLHGLQGDFAQAERCCRTAVEHAPDSSEAHTNLGVALAGRRDHPAAVDCYRRALVLRPDHAPIHNNLGAALNALGQSAEAKVCYERAIALNPNYAEAHYNLGNLLLTQSQAAAARDRYQTVIELHPKHAGAYSNLGKAQSQLGKPDEALASYQTALRLDPRQPGTHNNLGITLTELGEHALAIAHFKEALHLNPAYAEACNNLGLAYAKAGSLVEAVASYQKAIGINPNQAEFHNNLAIALARQEKLDDAVASYRTALALKPGYAEAHNNIGITLQALGRYDEAVDHYREALKLDPAHAETHTNLAVALYDQGRLEEAAHHAGEALRLDPGQIPARLNLGVALQAQGRLDEALRIYRELLELKPDHVEAHSNLLFSLNYLPGYTPAQIFQEHRRWAERHARQTWNTTHANARDPEKRLKVGYVSPDFRGHSVAYFCAPLLTHHDRERIEIFCYAQTSRGDAMTERLRTLSDHWRRTFGLSDAELAARIRADGIDILVDLAGHTANSRLMAFATHPAPVQISYLGYANTTCLPAMAYRLTDEWADPLGQEPFHSEELVRLPSGFLCYAPSQDAPAVAPPPSLANGHITFGSFNNLAKINPEVVALWARLLQAEPTARLIIKNGSLRDPGTRVRYSELIARHGIDRERVDLAPWTPAVRDHLAAYAGTDIGLDTFPYNGTTTTCEALWMGVPVIALAGDRHAARVGVSLLTRLGLSELIADSPDDYIRIARRLGQDPKHLSDLRNSLRARIRASTLGDGAAFTRELEDAYRELWRRWCDNLQM